MCILIKFIKVHLEISECYYITVYFHNKQKEDQNQRENLATQRLQKALRDSSSEFAHVPVYPHVLYSPLLIITCLTEKEREYVQRKGV